MADATAEPGGRRSQNLDRNRRIPDTATRRQGRERRQGIGQGARVRPRNDGNPSTSHGSSSPFPPRTTPGSRVRDVRRMPGPPPGPRHPIRRPSKRAMQQLLGLRTSAGIHCRRSRREARQGPTHETKATRRLRFRGSQARTSTYAGCGLPGRVRRPPVVPGRPVCAERQTDHHLEVRHETPATSS
jgi:hypothetical protein